LAEPFTELLREFDEDVRSRNREREPSKSLPFLEDLLLA